MFPSSLASLKVHTAKCRKKTCGCRDFRLKFLSGSLARDYPLVPSNWDAADAVQNDSWVHGEIDDAGSFSWICITCQGDVEILRQKDNITYQRYTSF